MIRPSPTRWRLSELLPAWQMLQGGGRGGDPQCCITRRLYRSTIIQEKKPTRYFLEERRRYHRGSLCGSHVKARWRRTCSEEQPVFGSQGTKGKRTKDKGRHRCDLWKRSQRSSSQPPPGIFIPVRQPFPRRLLPFHNRWQTKCTTKRLVRSAPNTRTLRKTRLFGASSRLQLTLINH